MPDMPTVADLFATIPARLRPLFAPDALPWAPLDGLAEFVERRTWPGSKGKVSDSAHIEGDVEIGHGTVVGPGAVIVGPVINGEDCLVHPHAFVRPHVVTGDRCVIGHSVEVTRSILLDDVMLAHFNYVGASILGAGVRFGAGAKVANLRFDERPIVVEGVDTGRQKLGPFLGDACRLGVNVGVGPGVVLMPGTGFAGGWLTRSGVYDQATVLSLWRQGQAATGGRAVSD